MAVGSMGGFSEVSTGRTVDLRDYIAVLHRQRAFILALTAMAVVLAIMYSYTRTPLYSARAEVLVSPTETSPLDAGDQRVSLETEREVVQSSTVASLVRDRLGTDVPVQQLLENLSVEVPADAMVLGIVFSDANPRTAQRVAQAFAASYLEFRRQQAVRAAISVTGSIQEQISELEREIADANAQIAASRRRSVQERNARLHRDVLTGQLAILRNELASLSIQDINPGQVIDSATLPQSPSSPRHPVDVALGLLAGLFLGVGGAFVRDRLDQRLRGASDLERVLGAPVLAIVPTDPGWTDPDRAHLATVEDARGPVAEAYRRLRASILVMAGRRRLRTLMVVSALEGEGKTTTAANLAAMLAQTGKSVILLSADLRRPRAHEFFHLQNDRGLTDVLLRGSRLGEGLRDPGVPNLRVLASGPVPDDPGEILESSRAREVINELADRAEFVIIDSPPVLAVADTLALAPWVDGVLLVADAATTNRDAILQAKNQLAQGEANLIGGVVANLGPSKTMYYYYERPVEMEAEPTPEPVLPAPQPASQVIAISVEGYAKRLSSEAYHQAEGTSPPGEIQRPDGTNPMMVLLMGTTRQILCFTNTGKIQRIIPSQIPQASSTSKGVPIGMLLGLSTEDGDRVRAVVPVKEGGAEQYILLATRQGLVKRVKLRDAEKVPTGATIIALDPGDRVVGAILTQGWEDIILVSRDGWATRFQQLDVRPAGPSAKGITGMGLRPTDQLVGLAVGRDDDELVTVTEAGFGKRTPIASYPRRSRGSRGLLTHRLDERTGRIVSAFVGSGGEELLVVSSGGAASRLPVSRLRRTARQGRGPQVMSLDDGQKVTRVLPVWNDTGAS
jgi:polysaccharide biosynthesis transport protein